MEAVQDALQLEKEVNNCLLKLHKTANDHGDPQMTDFIEGKYD